MSRPAKYMQFEFWFGTRHRNDPTPVRLPTSESAPLKPRVGTQSVAANKGSSFGFSLDLPGCSGPTERWPCWKSHDEGKCHFINFDAKALTYPSRIAEISAKINLALEVAALARKDTELALKQTELALKDSELALKQTKVIRQALTYTAKSKLARLQESLDELSTVLRFELFDRIMQAIDQDFKAQLSHTEIASLKAAKCNWVGCFIDSDDLALTPTHGQLRTIARKASPALPPPTLALFLYARRAARLGLRDRHARRWARVPLSLTYTGAALAAECQRTDFVAAHASTPSYDALFFVGGRDPREGIRSEIAEVEAEVAELERV
ncbi:hypothetical protein B0H16DRAFT_1448839 [Mycena metata]|uniref:Uncharacterized protein n=1 Tax=Mycena metata TaxID=1033252 RepID=A0AAD7K732_9AGAR|nr:hypothetical protein B0H16DRAFT_1448839 [Mycena metata]